MTTSGSNHSACWLQNVLSLRCIRASLKRKLFSPERRKRHILQKKNKNNKRVALQQLPRLNPFSECIMYWLVYSSAYFSIRDQFPIFSFPFFSHFVRQFKCLGLAAFKGRISVKLFSLMDFVWSGVEPVCRGKMKAAGCSVAQSVPLMMPQSNEERDKNSTAK